MQLRELARAFLVAAVLALGAQGAQGDELRVDVNTADAEMIARVLNGIGLSKAEAIVRYRNEHGRFTDPYDLTFVRGIGEATVEKNESRISLGD